MTSGRSGRRTHREARRLGDGETEVEGDGSGDAAETDEDTPADVDILVVARVVDDLVLEAFDAAEADQGRGEVAEALHGEDGGLCSAQASDTIESAREGERTIIRPRMRTAANSEVMVAERG